MNPKIPMFIITIGNPSVTVKSVTSFPECERRLAKFLNERPFA